MSKISQWNNVEESELQEVFRVKFMDLVFRLSSLSENRPEIIVKLLIELALERSNVKEQIVYGDRSFIRATDKVTQWLDNIEDLCNSTIQ